MEFSLTEEQQSYVSTAKAFAEDQLAPFAAEWDANNVLRKTRCARPVNLALWVCTPQSMLAGLRCRAWMQA